MKSRVVCRSFQYYLSAGFTALAVLASTDTFGQQPDPSFNAAIVVQALGIEQSLETQPDGKILVAGAITHVNGLDVRPFVNGAFRPVGLVRLMPNGTLDNSFSRTASGLTQAFALTLLGDGRILVRGFKGGSDQYLIRLNADGSLDGTYQHPLIPPLSQLGLAVLNNGQVLVLGENGVTRYNAEGSLDGTYALGSGVILSQSPQAIEKRPDGTLLLAGRFTFASNNVRFAIRLTATGDYDPTFAVPFSGPGYGFQTATRSDGKIVLAGLLFYSGSVESVRLLNADGTLAADAPLVNLQLGLSRMAPQANGGVILANADRSGAGPLIRRLLPTGLQLDNGFGALTELSSTGIAAIEVQPDGRFLAVGTFANINIARFLPESVPPVNLPPSISAVENQTLVEAGGGASSGALSFNVVDPEGAAVGVTATSSNVSVIPLANLLVSGSGVGRSIVVSHPPGAALGTSTITLTASDGVLSATTQFAVTVAGPPNRAPVLSAIANQSLVDSGTGASTGPLAFTVSDPDGQSVSVSATSSNQAVVADTSLVLGGSGLTRTITVSSVPGTAGGMATVSISATDGLATITRTFVVTVTVDVPPTTPRNLTAAVSGTDVGLSWLPPSQGGAQGYFLEVGFASNTTALSLPIGPVSAFNTVAPPGTFFVRVRAVSAAGLSGPSNEVVVVVGGVPGAPQQLQHTVSGSVVAFQWAPNVSGGAAASYLLVAGSGPGLADLASVPLPAGPPAFSVSAPAGVYFVRVHAQNVSGIGPPSNEVVVTVGGACVPPATPTGLAANPIPGGVTISWSAPSGAAPSGYSLLAGTAPGLVNVGSFALPAGTSVSAAAPAGQYFVRLVAVGACGSSAPSAELLVVVP